MTADFLVVGGGIVGVTVASALKRRYSDAAVVLIEKEPHLAAHASGRNSGVLHAGFYYSDDSLKARYSREGNRRLTEYCIDRGLPINRCGKLVVAQSEADLPVMDELQRRARVNAVELHRLTPAEARAIEPRAITVERALFSPSTSSVDPGKVVAALAADARALGVDIRTRTAYLGRQRDVVRMSNVAIPVGYLVNAAGAYADVIARGYDLGKRYRILPFKGLYLYADEEERLNTNVYPVPDLRNPFAGVHFSVTVAGRVKIGPTAMPALWREQYGWRGRFRAREFAEVLGRTAVLLARNDFGFRDLAVQEVRKYSRQRLINIAARLVSGVDSRRYRRWGSPGIRAQLLDLRERRLVMDFVTEGNDRSFHVLNAVSPAFTCALPFADYVVDEIAGLIR